MTHGITSSERKKLVRCRWVYRTKYGPDGKVYKHKAKLVAKGFSQVKGVMYLGEDIREVREVPKEII